MKNALAIILAALLLLTAVPVAAVQTDDNDIRLEEGTYVPNEVLVTFRSGAVKSDGGEAVGNAPVGEDYGDMMEAVSAEETAEAVALSETDILTASLGGGFTIEDTIVAGDTVYALVSSEQLDTETMIERLRRNSRVAYAEANAYCRSTDCDSYSLNDTLNSYLSHLNSPFAENKGGDKVDTFGRTEDNVYSLNAGTGWAEETDEKEIVVAVIDSGVNENHEDLSEKLWTNPGNIGLQGVHGFNVKENSVNITDTNGHGTHCSGVIAAQANNSTGVAGVTGDANVKIMMLSTGNSSADSNKTTAFCELGAFNYVLKAKQRGVNIVATSNSWGYNGQHYVKAFDDILNRLGEAGVINFIAAGNESQDLDIVSSAPTCSESPYTVVVGASDMYGRAAGFSCFGKSTVDLYAPGVNILSTVCYPCYFPNIDAAENRNKTTEYYGVFTPDTAVENNTVVPSTGGCDDSVKSFGAMEFHKQSAGELPDTARCEVKISTDRWFTKSDSPASLEVTIKDAQMGEEYYIYFPYKKNPATVSDKDTDFSLYVMDGYSEGNHPARVAGGEVVVDESGTCSLTGGGFASHLLTVEDIGKDVHMTVSPPYESNMICSAAELGDKTSGIGIMVTPNGDINDGQSHDIRFYIDSLAVSKPNAEISADSSYDIMTGTSMACPSAAGAYALLASIYPQEDGQSDKDYAAFLRTKLFSCVRHDDRYTDLCSTGGVLDLSLLNTNTPSLTDAVCDTQNGTITLYGSNLSSAYQLYYQRIAQKDSEPVELTDVTFSHDGKSLMINNASELFGTYTTFTLSDGSGTRASLSTFLTKGQKKLNEVMREWYPETLNTNETVQTHPFRELLTDTNGEKLYGYEPKTGVVSVFDGSRFVDCSGTDIRSAAKEYYRGRGFDDYELANHLEINPTETESPLTEGNKVYQLVSVKYSPYADIEEDECTITRFLASLDFTEASPRWSFSEISYPEGFFDVTWNLAVFEGKLYFIGCTFYNTLTPADTPQTVYSCDLSTKSWKREADFPVNMSSARITCKGGRMVVAGGILRIEGDGVTADQMISRGVYCLENGAWKCITEIPYVGRHENYGGGVMPRVEGAFTPVKNGVLSLNSSADGLGNVFLCGNDGVNQPVFYTVNDYLNSFDIKQTAVETRDGVYYASQISDNYQEGWALYLLPVSSGAYESSYAADILGDVDLDGDITVIDVTLIQRATAEMTELDELQRKLADVNGDGRITISDATCIQRYLAELNAPEGIGKPIPYATRKARLQDHD